MLPTASINTILGAAGDTNHLYKSGGWQKRLCKPSPTAPTNAYCSSVGFISVVHSVVDDISVDNDQTSVVTYRSREFAEAQQTMGRRRGKDGWMG